MGEIRKKLTVLRAEMGMTQEQLAELIEMPISTYRKKENGKSKLTLEEAYRISTIANKTIDEIFLSKK